MLKVMTLVGTRPELIKMSRVIAELDKQVNHVLVHSGQNYDFELNQVFFDDLEIRKPDYFLGAAGDTAAKTIAEVISKADEVFEAEKPDALLLYGDTNTCLAVIAAKRRKIPVFHMEAGNRCFDQRVPEELNRKVLDHLSDINMVLTEHARRYLIAEGIRPETIIKTGSHMEEVLDYYMPKILTSDVLAREGLEQDKFFIISAHREENVDTPENLRDLLKTLRALADKYQYPIIVSTHPRTRKRLEAIGESLDHPLIRFSKPFGLLDYIKLQMSAFCVLSDSGTITEEASLLNLPAITIRNAHERPEGMDEGTLIMSGLKVEGVLDAVRVVTSQHDRSQRVIPVVRDYQAGPVSKQVVRVVLSYTDYINRTVWSKS
ncbi:MULTISPECIES: non-hydrolyzing UDP-N-acetylglucosamine 2-epimerase [Pseudomonas]|jgi:UDP-N-acetylglucosamine 2-epimerase (non-hydrolysing)|uniref:UDP-N-acetylglucosamine 2-epimerase (Non-hydrolyzing) n=1 Tax=Pseudomonas laurylsulfatiphila TaxID=2011015 RepID=A0A2S6FLL5_9PSED|nr:MULTISPECIES: UDP-N-acetylglucosamine 2-epimerase (non-hydrolyzing) [Pseudomonas]MDF9898987.1 UDP-N-acetylglucosamine 2-epimerase (non-hydrolyzing) [Pseudomonas reinekei]PNB73584.1 UDP-N-acetylglucosamine 2-epimerase (non-hydrolyzing) [Pseudomonas sp. GW456-E7]AFY18583.1 UDP-N-acetylglucosamine 2-epimerase [Pseudomonas sp. UW4]MDF9902695.1 UDP-N-acetylglucosamine 2-epimerase (non-hydrolyzing) [Pseudomonas reinekei]PMZ75395.1 UDP-N-acetylglucosamine 2-epimerase (non-hydrolyzing) [Pseudomonas